MFSAALYFLSSSKKMAAAVSTLATLGTGFHFAVVKPSMNTSSSLPFSLNPLDKARKLGQDSTEDPNFNLLPPTPLSLDFLDSSKNTNLLPLLHPTVRKIIEDFENDKDGMQKTENKNYKSQRINNEHQKYHNYRVSNNSPSTLIDAKNLDKYVNTHEEHFFKTLLPSQIQDIEPFKSYLYSFTPSMLYHDLLTSIISDATTSFLQIHPSSVRLNLELEKVEKDPAKHHYVNYFHTSFTIVNPSYYPRLFYKHFILPPRSSTNLSWELKRGILSVREAQSNMWGTQSASWGIRSDDGERWVLREERIYPSKHVTLSSPQTFIPSLGITPFFDRRFSSKRWDISVARVVSYEDLERAGGGEAVRGITKEIAKSDLEFYYGPYTFFLLKKKLEDIVTILNIMTKPIMKNGSGQPVSFLDQLLEDSSLRNSLYSHLQLPLDARLVFEAFFSREKNKEAAFTTEELESWVNAMRYDIDTWSKSLKYEFWWDQTPIVTPPTSPTSHPHISFGFGTRLSWSSPLKLRFAGKYVAPNDGTPESVTDLNENNDNDRKKRSTTDSQDSQNTKGTFNLPEKIKNLKDILQPLSSTLTQWIQGVPLFGTTADVFGSIIPDLNQFLGWPYVELSADESITISYSTPSSPLWFSASSPSLLTSPYTPGAVLGWKVGGGTRTIDLSSFSKLFASLWEERIGGYKNKDGSTFGISQLLTNRSQLESELKSKPLSTLLHIIHSVFDPNYQKSDKKSDDTERPLHIFFKHLLSRPFPLPGSHLDVPLSGLFYRSGVTESSSEEEKDLRTTELLGIGVIEKDEDKDGGEAVRQKRSPSPSLDPQDLPPKVGWGGGGKEDGGGWGDPHKSPKNKKQGGGEGKKGKAKRSAEGTEAPNKKDPKKYKSKQDSTFSRTPPPLHPLSKTHPTLFHLTPLWFPSYASFHPHPPLIFNRFRVSDKAEFNTWSEQHVPTNWSLAKNSMSFKTVMAKVFGEDSDALRGIKIEKARLIGEGVDWEKVIPYYTRLEVGSALRGVTLLCTSVSYSESWGLWAVSINWPLVLGGLVQREMHLLTLSFPSPTGHLLAWGEPLPGVSWENEAVWRGWLNVKVDTKRLNLGRVTI